MSAYIQQYLRGGWDGERDQLNWRLPLYPVLAALIVFILAGICESLILHILVSILVLYIISASLVYSATRKERRRCLSILSMLIIYSATSVFLVVYDVKNPYAIRWLMWSHSYKAKVLAQPASANGEFKHVEWDGWGFPGAGNTVVFLVFDPTDSLSAAALSHQPGKFNGLPCEVDLVHQLQSHWYTVRFYTDEYWGRRNALNCGGPED